MKNLTNAYLVLSVSDIKAMLRAAELEQKVRGEDRETITIVLEDIAVHCEGEKYPQIASWSVNAAVAKCARESAEDIAAGLTWHKTGYHAETTCMNHSDAAI